MPKNPQLVAADRRLTLAIARRITKRCEELGLRNCDLVRATSRQSNVISAWKKGDYRPGEKDLLALSNALQCSVIWLTTGREDESQQPAPDGDALHTLCASLDRMLTNALGKDVAGVLMAFWMVKLSKAHHEAWPGLIGIMTTEVAALIATRDFDNGRRTLELMQLVERLVHDERASRASKRPYDYLLLLLDRGRYANPAHEIIDRMRTAITSKLSMATFDMPRRELGYFGHLCEAVDVASW